MGADFDWKQMWQPTLQGQIWMLADREVPRAEKKIPGQQLCYFPFAPPLAVSRQCIVPHLVLLSISWDGFFFLEMQSCIAWNLSLVRDSFYTDALELSCSAAGTWWRIRKSFVWLWANQIVSHAGFILTKSGVLSFWMPKLNSNPFVIIRGGREKTKSRSTLNIRWDGPEVFMTLLPLLSLLYTDKMKWIREYMLPSLQIEKQRVCDLLNSTGLSNCDRCSCW